MIRLGLWVAIACAIGVTSSRAGGSDPAEVRPFLRSGQVSKAHRCDRQEYLGAQTLLYADRSYHTEETLAELVGLHFCRAKRHGQALWILEVARPTHLLAIASDKHELEQGGWRPLDAAVRVDAKGLALDRLYTKPFEPGRHTIRYGRARTAHPIF